MKIEGQADGLSEVLFPYGLVPQILRLIVDTWGDVQRPKDDEDEPKITNRFVKALEREKRRRGARFRVMAHAKDLEALEGQTGTGFVEIDIYVPFGYDERCYFGIEAKKLNTTSATGQWESRAGEYAGKEGMGRFVGGCYAAYQCEGAMVGYVMDADCVRARTSVCKAIETRAEMLRVSAPCQFDPSQHLVDYPHAFETRHQLDRGLFTIHHLLLAV